MSNQTFTMIKPDAVKSGYSGAILDHIIKAGFHISAMKLTRLTPEKAGEFYAIHKERPFYQELINFMSSGPIVAAILIKKNAVEEFRTLIGATDPAKAADGTIRKLYAASVGKMLFMEATAMLTLNLKAISFSLIKNAFKRKPIIFIEILVYDQEINQVLIVIIHIIFFCSLCGFL